MKPKILAIHLKSQPKPESLPELAKLLIAFTPSIGVRPPDLIYLDLTSTFHLFGGEEQTKKSIEQHFAAQKIPMHMALADDVTTAGALALHGGETLAQLPIHMLHFLVNPLSSPTSLEDAAAREAISLLTLLGIKTLGEFARLPASTIGTRFGKMGVELHRRARGEASLSFHPFKMVGSFRESYSFEFPVVSVDPVLFIANQLLTHLESRLKTEMRSILQMAVFVETENGEEYEIVVPLLRPLRKRETLLAVMKEKLYSLGVSSPILSVAIELSLPVSDRGGQFHLFDRREQNSEKLDELLGRLVAGVGPTFISAAALRARYRPEQSWEGVSFEPFSPHTSSFQIPMGIERPTILLSSPHRLMLKKQNGVRVFASDREKFEVSTMHGPERLVGEWWDEKPHQRDYFRVETKNGQHLWVFRNGSGVMSEFYLHGYFD